MGHLPVMVDEVLVYLGHIRSGLIVDGTLGLGGHSEVLLNNTPGSVSVVGLDRDPDAIRIAEDRLAGFRSRFSAIHGNYGDPSAWQKNLPKQKVMGFLLDLGLSSEQLDRSGRGFSFRDEECLDMRFDSCRSDPTAADLVNTLEEKELADLIYRFGEERLSRKIAHAIVHRREMVPFTSARDLAEVISSVCGKYSPIHPATRTFQALRIAVNHELDHLQAGLKTAYSLLADSGRLVVISYHSLEDRIVKQFLQSHSGRCTCPENLPVCRCDRKQAFRILTRKPIIPGPREIQFNPRSRSARLRCAERLREKGVAA